MADQQIFLAGMENYKQSLSLSDMEPNLEFFNHSAINPIYQHYPSGFISLPLHNQHLPAQSSQNFIHHNINSNLLPNILSHDTDHAQRKRKSVEMSSSPISCPQVSENGTRSKSSVGRRKQAKRDEEEVIHVRAKRGQATDSHSLAERVRREKINERLRCLQDIVPGCYKTMGMAVMLDEIINYVQSLQNQVEFLSMKLTAASSFYDFNSESDDVLGTIQRAKAFEASKMHNINGPPSDQSAPLTFNFEYCPQFPHNR